MPALYEDVKTALITLDGAVFVGITTDGWTSRSNESFVTFTPHFLDKEWQLHNSVPQTRTMADSHTGANLAKLVYNVLKEWHIPPNKVAAVTTDNASNMVVMVRETNLTHVKCFAHTFNLASQKALKVSTASRVLGIIRRIVSYFHKSLKAFAILKEKQVLLKLPRHKWKNDVVTRWNSYYEMVDRYLEQQPAIQASLLTKDLRKAGDTHLPTSLNEVDMSIAEDIVQVMKPMKTATTVMCDEQQPTLSVVYPLYSSLLKSTAPANCDDTDSRTIREMKRAMHEDLNHRYQRDVDVSLLHNAAAMDPRFKDLPFLSDVHRMIVFSNIAVEASLLVNIAACEVTVKQETDDKTAAVPALPLLPDLPPVESPQPESPTQTDSDTSPPRAKVIKLEPSGSSGSSKCALDDLLGDVYIIGQVDVPSRSKLDIVNEEINMYRKSPSLQLSSNAISMWQENNIYYPYLSKLARKYLCIPGTSVPSERVFSTYGDIVTAQRASLKAAHVDRLVFLKKNLKM